MMINGNKRSLIITTSLSKLSSFSTTGCGAASAFSYARQSVFFPTASFLFSQPLFFSNGGSTEAEINKKIKRMSNQVSECLSTRDVAR